MFYFVTTIVMSLFADDSLRFPHYFCWYTEVSPPLSPPLVQASTGHNFFVHAWHKPEINFQTRNVQ